MIVFDTVRRYFEYKGYEVNYVSNFTDVDDKIIKKAIEEGVDADTISKRYIAECKKDMEALNIEPATKNPLATEEICGMLDMIQTLIDKGYAYAAADGTVYFRVKQFKDYTWHWFLVVGYEDLGEDLRIKTATYGEAEEFSLKEMWDTGYEEKGGLIRLRV